MNKYIPLRIANGALPLPALLHIEEVGVGIVLYDPKGTNVSLSSKLKFPFFNNGGEYEALSSKIIGLISLYK